MLAAALTVGRVQVRSVGNGAALAVCIVPSAALFHSVFLFSFIWDEADKSGHTPKWNLSWLTALFFCLLKYPLAVKGA